MHACRDDIKDMLLYIHNLQHIAIAKRNLCKSTDSIKEYT